MSYSTFVLTDSNRIVPQDDSNRESADCHWYSFTQSLTEESRIESELSKLGLDEDTLLRWRARRPTALARRTNGQLIAEMPVFVSLQVHQAAVLRIAHSQNFLITQCDAEFAGLVDVFREVIDIKLEEPSPAAVLQELFERLADMTAQDFMKVRRQADELSHHMHASTDNISLNQILTLKDSVSHLAMMCEDQLYFASMIASAHVGSLVSDRMQGFFRATQRLLEHVHLGIARLERVVEGMHQLHLLALQHAAINRLRDLTTLSAIFLPLGLIAGVYGMNFKRMPELEWTYGYPNIVSIMLFIAATMFGFFTKRGWYR